MRGIRYEWAMVVLAVVGMVATAGWAEVSTTGDTKDDGSTFYAGYNANTTGGLTIDAGSVFNRWAGYLGYSIGATGTATITGTGSKWANSWDLYVGNSGRGTLNIENGGQVSNANGYLGHNSGSTGAVMVTGAGSKWTSSGFLYVGQHGSGTLTVSDGGFASAKTLCASLGDLHGDGTIMVNGGVLDADLSFDATHGLTQTLAFGSGGALQFAVDGTGNLGVGYRQSGSLRIAESRSVTSAEGYLGYYSGSTGTATITGAGSKWTNSRDISVGYLGSGTLQVEAGGQVSSANGYLGGNSGSTGEASITGAGSKWANSGILYVGYNGSGVLRVEAGGQVSSGAGYLGFLSASTGTATVSGAGSKWANSGDLYIGQHGTLTVSDGGVIGAKTLYASLSNLYGDGSIAIQSGVVLDADLSFDAAHGLTQTLAFGSGGTLQFTIDGTSAVGVGYVHSGSLRIAEGRLVSSGYGYLGYYSGSTGTATITGAGSKWTNAGPLYVGRYGNGTLTVSNGGAISAKSLYASLSDLYGDGSITARGGVLDADLSFDAAHGLRQTLAFGSGGTLQFTVDGTSDLGVGYKRSGTLRIAEGSSVSSIIGYLGYHSGSTGTAIVTGVGSKWTNSWDLYVGNSGSGTLNIENGGQVSSHAGHLGYNFGSTGTAIVTGVGSKWTNNGELFVGNSGSGTLRVEAGAQVSSAWGALGGGSGFMGEATITGAGSKWTNSSYLYVGHVGSGTLRVEGGGEVSSTNTYVGYNSGSSGKVTVTGAGSTWTNFGQLWIGDGGRGLVEQSGGTVSAGSMVIASEGSYVLSGGLLEGSTSMTIQTGGSLSWQAGQVSVPSVTLDGGRLYLSPGGDKLLKLSSLNLTNAGTLDLGDNAMIVQADATSGGAVLEFISGKIGAARNTQSLWNGTGITSSVARDEGSGLYGLGAILNVDAQGKAIYSVFEGEAVDANSILVKYTLNGDADLNGVVDGSDYFFIDKGFLSKASGYGNGDFDYNGVIDGSDYFLIDKAYLATHAGGGAAGVNAVPEPGALGMVMIAAAAGLVRRRRG